MQTAEIYTKKTCPWCIKAKELLKTNNIGYAEFVLGIDDISKVDIEKKIGNDTKVTTVPQIFVDGEYIGGCTELMKFLENQRNATDGASMNRK